MAVTSKDVAMRAQVSLMTVSRVFSPRLGFPIAEATRERVRIAATELGYQPNRLARALVTGRTHIITLHIPEMSVYYAEVVRSIQALLQKDHYEMISFRRPACGGSVRPDGGGPAAADQRPSGKAAGHDWGTAAGRH